MKALILLLSLSFTLTSFGQTHQDSVGFSKRIHSLIIGTWVDVDDTTNIMIISTDSIKVPSVPMGSAIPGCGIDLNILGEANFLNNKDGTYRFGICYLEVCNATHLNCLRYLSLNSTDTYLKFYNSDYSELWGVFKKKSEK